MDSLTIAVIALALAFDFLNGIHDSSNVVATMISSRAFSPRLALGITALANLVGAIRQRSGGASEVQLVTGAETQRVAAYPDPAARPTAGDWNRAAAANNRLEIRVQRGSP